MSKLSTYTYLTAIVIIFHIVGLVGIGVLHNDAILKTTPLHLLLMFVLLLVSYKAQWWQYAQWWVPAFIISFVAEWIGVQTGWLFGSYAYTPLLGYTLSVVPLLIGCNWVVVMTGSISLAEKVSKNKWLVVIIAATIATAYDWVLEPMAIELGYWQWKNNEIPAYNYVCWWGVAFLLSWLWQFCKIRANKFGITLFMVQLLFFILLRLIL
jgi:putative membrane protein